MNEQNTGPYFLHCRRCLGHGHFVIPPEGAQFEVFSLNSAHYQLHMLALAGRISMNNLAVLTSQVMNSGLPESRPPDVDEFIGSFCNTENWMARYSQSEENE